MTKKTEENARDVAIRYEFNEEGALREINKTYLSEPLKKPSLLKRLWNEHIKPICTRIGIK